jgi:hypothetical protein
LNYREFVKRVTEYSKATGIQMLDSGRHLNLKGLGLPDPRGFAPHLRSLLLDKKSFQSFRSEKADFSGERRWLIHDLLHIIFYDFAFCQLGPEAFEDPARFLEVHLASEAFAVLALDYHVLSKTPGEGLAVEFHRDNWPRFQSLNPQLPHYLSADFVRALCELYLAGARRPFESRKKDVEFENWSGHELRYAEKQRLYASQWRADLEGREFTGEIPLLESSHIHEAVRELLSLLLGERRSWSEYARSCARRLEGVANYFENLKKYRGLQHPLDFRFTDFRSCGEKTWVEALERTAKPNPSQLFLFWQLASSVDDWEQRPMEVFRDLQKSANTPEVDLDLWRMTQEILIQNQDRVEAWPPDTRLKSCFFLP